MKRINNIGISLLLLGTMEAQAQTVAPTPDSVMAEEKPVPVGPQIVFKEMKKDVGTVRQGEVVEHRFLFKNTGNKPLIVSDVKTTCNCTATEWITDPVLPGEIVAIKVRFDTAGKSGAQSKVITVLSNSLTDNKAYLILSAFVEPKVASR